MFNKEYLVTPPFTPPKNLEFKPLKSQRKRIQGHHSRSTSLSMTSSTKPPSPTVVAIPIHAPKPSKGQSHSRRPSTSDGNRPPSRSEQMLRDALNRDTARRPSLDRAETSPIIVRPRPQTNLSGSGSGSSSSRSPPTSASDLTHFNQPPLTPHEAQLRARLHGALKRAETEASGLPVTSQYSNPYVSPTL